MAENAPGKLKYFYYILPSVLFIVFFSVLISDESFRRICLWDSDINWILKTGEYIYTNGFKIPQTDLFSYTHPALHWVVYQWLFEVIAYVVFSIGGYTSLGTFTTLMLAFLILGLYVIQRKLSVNPLYSIISILPGFFLLKNMWYTRPAIFTYLFVAILILLLIKAEKISLKYLYALPVLFLLWANIHLGFTFGILLLLLYLIYVGVRYFIVNEYKSIGFIKTLSFCTALSILATLLTPYGAELYTYMVDLINSPHMNANINELLSPDFHKVKYLFFIIMLASIITLSHWAKKPHLYLLICLAITCSMSLSFLRNIPFFVIFAVPVLGIFIQNLHESVVNNDNIKQFIRKPVLFIDYIQRKEDSFASEDFNINRIYINVVIIALFIIILLPLQNNPAFKNTFLFSMDYTKHRPFNAYNFALKYKIPGNLFTTPPWGSYAISKLYPEYKTFVDTRFDMYGDKFFKNSYDILEAQPGWEKLLKKHNVNWIVLPLDSLLASRLRHDPKNHWKEIYKDDAAYIFVKNTEQNRNWFIKSDVMSYKPGQ